MTGADGDRPPVVSSGVLPPSPRSVDAAFGVAPRGAEPWIAMERPPVAAGSLLPAAQPGGPRHGRRRGTARRLAAIVLAAAMLAALLVLVDLRGDRRAGVAAPSAAPAARPLDVTTPPQITVDTASAAPASPAGTAPAADAPGAAPGQGAPADPAPSPTQWTNPDFPPPGVGASPSPLGAPSPPPGGSESFGFTAYQADGVAPIAYDPCRPLRWVLRPDNAPPEGEVLLQEAFGVLQRTTGLQPRFDGTTTEAPELGRSPYQPDRYGQAWAPVLVAWVTPAEMPELEGDVLGLAGSVSARAGDLPSVYVSGTVFLDGPQLAELYDRPGGRDLVRSTIEHELGHLVGLGHVEDPAQLMYPQATGEILTFQAGDLAGLARLGSGACVPQI